MQLGSCSKASLGMASLGRSCGGFALRHVLEFALSCQPMSRFLQSVGYWASFGRSPAFGRLRPRAADACGGAPSTHGLATVVDPLLEFQF